MSRDCESTHIVHALYPHPSWNINVCMGVFGFMVDKCLMDAHAVCEADSANA